MAKYKLQMAVKFKRDVKRCKKRGLPLDELWTVVRTLLRGETLDKKYKAQLLAYIKAFKATTGQDADALTYHIDI